MKILLIGLLSVCMFQAWAKSPNNKSSTSNEHEQAQKNFKEGLSITNSYNTALLKLNGAILKIDTKKQALSDDLFFYRRSKESGDYKTCMEMLEKARLNYLAMLEASKESLELRTNLISWITKFKNYHQERGDRSQVSSYAKEEKENRDIYNTQNTKFLADQQFYNKELKNINNSSKFSCPKQNQ